MEISYIFTFLGLGLCAGFAAGLLGIGGGMVMVPILTFIFSVRGFSLAYVVHMAIATSLAVVFFTSISSALAHHRRGAVLWSVALLLVPGVLIGSWIGPAIAVALNTRYLAALFGLFVFLSAVRMLLHKQRHVKGAGRLPNMAGMSAAGLGIGALSGLVGAGGGFITVPFLAWGGVSIHNAVATSAVMGFPIALIGVLGYVYQGWEVAGLPSGSIGYVYVPAFLSVAVASVLSAPLGARTAHRMNVEQLRSTFACMLLLLALYMLLKAATA